MDIFRFENPTYFALFAVLPLLLALFFFAIIANKKKLKRFGNDLTISKLMPWRSVRRPWIKFAMLATAVVLLIFALANPLIGNKLQEAKHQGVDIIIALDVSRSMLAEDIRPNRLERAKMAVSRLVDQLDKDRVGLVVFAGNAVTQVPLTPDHTALKMVLRTVNTNSVSMQGTAIGSAIERSLVAFDDEDLQDKIIIIVSDGENHLDDPIEWAKAAAQAGVKIHTVGIGSKAGAPIPEYRNNQLVGYVRDKDGNTVISRFDEVTLTKIATSTGGVFRVGEGADLGLRAILDEIRKTDKQTYDSMVFADYESRYYYFVAFALILLLLEILVFERKNKWLEKLKLFD
jgi:Ca-activated chloride channel family protein